MSRVIHFEIPADEPERAAKFYGDAFGWKFTKWEGPMEYWLVETGPESARGINGGLLRRQQPGAGVVNVLDVASVDDAVTAVEKAGGSTVVPKMAVQGIGWAAYFQDPEGNIFGVMQGDPSAG